MANSQSPSMPYNFKVVLLGEGCVGKTSLVVRYVDDTFNSKHVTTVQASFLNKKLNIDGKRINLAIWDTAGQEKFHALGPIYYRASNGAVLVYDITAADTFRKVKNWVRELKKMLGADICLIIAGNKTDLDKDRTVPLEEAEAYAAQVGALHFQTSAKLNTGIEEMFLKLSQKMLERVAEQQETENASISRQGSQRRNVLVVEDDAPEAAPSKSCCSSLVRSST